MLLPREQIYRDRSFEELMEDEFTRDIFEYISQNEDNMEWRFCPLEMTAEEQYAELFNITYYFLTEAQMRPYPQLRIGEYEIYIEERAKIFSFDPPCCKDFIFSIIFYIVNEHYLIKNSAFCERLRLRSDEDFYNLLSNTMPINKVWDWLDLMNFPIDINNSKYPSESQSLNTCVHADSPFIIAKNKQTSVLVVLETMYKAKWIRKVDGSKYRSRDEMINDVMRILFNHEEIKDIKQKLSSSKRRTLDGQKKYFDELMGYINNNEIDSKE